MLETKYNHESVEKDRYENWLKNGYFKNITFDRLT